MVTIRPPRVVDPGPSPLPPARRRAFAEPRAHDQRGGPVMMAVVVYESMYGNTHVVADHIADGLRPHMEVEVWTPGSDPASLGDDVDLLVVGGPTHIHAMSTNMSRKAA